MWNQAARWTVCAIAIAACGGGIRPEYREAYPAFEMTCKEWQPGNEPVSGCFPPNCAGNSPVANTFPINGLSVGGSGACNTAGVQLVPRSLSGGGCPGGTSLTIDPKGKRLVGTRDGAVVCANEQLAGATFLVRSATSTLSLAIASVRRFDADREDFEGYRIESGGSSTCDPETAERVARELVPNRGSSSAVAAPRPPAADTYRRASEDDLVIAVPGPLYDERDHAVANTGAEYFNLACAGDALAKRTLYHLYTSDDMKNETALRMLAANYCGRSFTLRGAQIEWVAPGSQRRHEAGWQKGVALCIDTPRLMMLEVGGSRVSPQDLPGELQPLGCEPAGGKGRGTCDENAWTEALRAECKLPACGELSAADFESYVHKDSLILERK